MKDIHRLGSHSLPRLVLAFSLPAIVGMVSQALYNIVDRFFLGRALGDAAVSAVVVSFPLMLVFMAFGMLTGIGGGAAFSIFLGQKRADEARHTLGNAIHLTAVLGLVLMVIGLVFQKPLLRLFGATPDILDAAAEYYVFILFGGLFSSLSMSLNNFLRAQAAPVLAMTTLLLGAGLNTVLDPILISGFNMGVRGAGLATLISMAASSIWVLFSLSRTPMGKQLSLKDLRLRAPIVQRIIGIGLSPFFMQLAAALVNVALNSQLVAYGGPRALSHIGVLYATSMIFLMPLFGLNQGTQPIIGYNFGAGLTHRVRHVLALTSTLATLVTGLAFVLTRIDPEGLFALFLPHQPELWKEGGRAASLFFLAYPVLGLQIAGVGYFQSIGQARKSLILTLSRQVLFLLPLLYILPLVFGLDGIWFAAAASDALAFLITAFFLIREWSRLNSAASSPPKVAFSAKLESDPAEQGLLKPDAT